MLDVRVVADVFVSELVELLFKCTVLVVFVVGDIVQPGGGDGVHNEVMVLSAVAGVLSDDVYGQFGDCLHVSMSVRFVSVSTCCLNEFREHVPVFFDGGGGVSCHRCCCCLMLLLRCWMGEGV